MNTTTTQETTALTAAIPAQSMLLVPLSQLRPSKRKNVRKTAGAPITALAASIERVGLLQNLTVVQAEGGEHYDVVAGNRRLAALKLLAKTHRIARDYAVPCLQVADASALTASLSENVQREAMHPPTSTKPSPRWWPKGGPSRTLLLTSAWSRSPSSAA